MNRLTFLKKASLISTLPFFSNSHSLLNFENYKIGLQLFSVKDAMEKDEQGKDTMLTRGTVFSNKAHTGFK